MQSDQDLCCLLNQYGTSIFFHAKFRRPLYLNLIPGFSSLLDDSLNEPCHEKTNILHMRKKKMQICCEVTAQLISAFVFAT